FSDRAGIQIWDAVARKLATTCELPKHLRPSTAWSDRLDTYASCLAFTPDGRRLATGHPDGTILFWDVDLPVPKPGHLSTDEVNALWTALKHADPAKAWQAVWRLADSPDNVLPLLRDRVKPVESAAAEITGRLLADLDSASFAKREAASKRLKDLGV